MRLLLSCAVRVTRLATLTHNCTRDLLRVQRCLLGQHARVLSTSAPLAVRAEHAVERLHETYDHGIEANYGKLWKWERYLAIAMLPLIPVGVFLTPGCIYVDNFLAVSMCLHGYGGLAGMCTDYLSWRGKTLYKTAKWGFGILSIVGMGGLLMFNYEDVGLTNALRLLWTL